MDGTAWVADGDRVVGGTDPSAWRQVCPLPPV